LTVSSTASSNTNASSGSTLSAGPPPPAPPSPAAVPTTCHRVRLSSSHPLRLSVRRDPRPWRCRVAFPAASGGGGKSRLRRVDTHLQRLLETSSLKFHHRRPHRLLRPVDHPTLRRPIDRIGHPLQRRPNLRLHGPYKLFPVHLLQPFHGLLLK